MPNGHDKKMKSKKGASMAPELARAFSFFSAAFNSSTPCTSCLFLASFRLTLHTRPISKGHFPFVRFPLFFFSLLRSRDDHDYRRLEIGRGQGRIDFSSPARDRGSSWIERTYLTLPGWNGGKKSGEVGEDTKDLIACCTHLRPRKLCSRPRR